VNAVRTPTPTVPVAAPRARRSRAARRRMSGRAPWWLFVLLFAGVALMIGPFLWMVVGAFKPPQELRTVTPTVLVAVIVTLANLLFCSMAGYALAKLRFAGQRPLFGLVLATLMVPGSVTLVPLFVLMSKLGLVNTYAAVILPFAAGAFGVFLMRQFMMGIPNDLLDAARIDGAGEWRIFRVIVLPLSKAPLAALGIFQFLASWNNFLWPLVVLTDESKYTLPVAVATFAIGQQKANYGLLMAGAVALAVPVILVFLLLQRHFTQSIAMTGLKG
jgi:multiple sugar transport system permease protein